jgi:hypothetical protein
VLFNRRQCFPWGPYRGVIRGHSQKMGRSTEKQRTGLGRVLEMAIEGDRRNGNKGISLCQEDFKREFKLQ